MDCWAASIEVTAEIGIVVGDPVEAADEPDIEVVVADPEEPEVENVVADPDELGVEAVVADPDELGVDVVVADPDELGVEAVVADPDELGVDIVVADPDELGVDAIWGVVVVGLVETDIDEIEVEEDAMVYARQVQALDSLLGVHSAGTYEGVDVAPTLVKVLQKPWA